MQQEIKRSTLAGANEARDWRIHTELAQRLIEQARELYAGGSFAIELENTAYALDSTTVDLCLSLVPWALFRRNKSAVKMPTLLDLRGNIPSSSNLDLALHFATHLVARPVRTDALAARVSENRPQNPSRVTAAIK